MKTSSDEFELDSNGHGWITVPKISAVELTALTVRELDLTDVIDAEGGKDFSAWDFYSDAEGRSIPGPGLKFQVFVYDLDFLFGRDYVQSHSARRTLRELGFMGHVGAYMQWRRVCKLQGYYTTLPEDAQCREAGDRLYVPYSAFDESLGMREILEESLVDAAWARHFKIVGFCPIES